MTLPFPDGELPIGLEVAFGEDPLSDPTGWTWTDLSDRIMSQSLTVTRGRADETSQISPTQTSIVLNNPDGELTPGNPLSSLFPNVDVGQPARMWTEGTTRILLTPNLDSYAAINGFAAAYSSGEVDVRVDMHTVGASDGVQNWLALHGDQSGQFSWLFYYHDDHTLAFAYSTNGTALSVITTPFPVLPYNVRTTARVTFDTNNGAGASEFKFYVGESVDGPWTQVGDTQLFATTSINSPASSRFRVGTRPSTGPTDVLASNGGRAEGSVYAVKVLNGINGTAVVNADFTEGASGSTSFNDATGNSWTVAANAALTNREYHVFGTTDEWVVSYPSGDLSAHKAGGVGSGECRTMVTIADITRRLAQTTSVDSPLYLYNTGLINYWSSLWILNTSYWPMEDPQGSQGLSSTPGSFEGDAPIAGIPIDLASDNSLPGSKPLPQFEDGTTITFPTNSFASIDVFSWYMNLPSAPGSLSGFLNMQVFPGVIPPGRPIPALLVMDFTGTSQISIALFDTTFTTIGTATSGTLTDFFGSWHHMTLTYDRAVAGGNLSLSWVPAIVGQGETGSISTTLDAVANGSFVGSTVIPANTAWSGLSMGHLVHLTDPLFTIDESGADGYESEEAVARMLRIGNQVGIPTTIIGDQLDSVTLGPQPQGSALEIWQDAALADGGLLYGRRDGLGIVYRTRSSMYNQPEAIVLDGLLDELVIPVSHVRDDQRIVNRVTVTSQAGQFSVEDADSIAKNGLYEATQTLNLDSPGETSDAAGMLLARGLDPDPRMPNASTNIGVSPELLTPWHITDIGNRVGIVNLPPQSGGDKSLMLEGYSDTLADMDYLAAMDLSPGSSWDFAQINANGVGSEYVFRLDTDGSIIGQAVDGDDTIIQAYSPDLPWYAGDVPFDVGIRGERITVTAAAAVVPQTFPWARDTGASATSHVAPSITPQGSTDLLLAAWLANSGSGTYTAPGGMTGITTTSLGTSRMFDAQQTLASGAETGTRAATYSTGSTWSAVILSISGSPAPVLQQTLSGTLSGGSATMVPLTTMSLSVGWWLIAVSQGVSSNAAFPIGGQWTNLVTGIRRISVAPVLEAGAQTINFTGTGFTNNAHIRLYVVSGAGGILQALTVTRSVNDAVKSHDVGEAISLWDPAKLAR